MKRRKTISIVLCAMLVLSLLASCAGDNSANTSTPADSAASDPGSAATAPSTDSSSTEGQEELAPINLTFYHSTGSGGTWPLLAEGIAEAVRVTMPDSQVTTMPGSSEANVARVAGGDPNEVGYTSLTTLYEAIKGEDSFETPVDNVYVIGATHATVAQFVVSDSVGITSFAQIAADHPKINVSMHQAGSANELYGKRVMAEYGFTVDDIVSWGGSIVNLAEGDSCDAIKDGQVDVFMGGGAPPNSRIIELASSRPIQFLELEETVIQALVDKYGYTATSLPASYYDFLTEDYSTFSYLIVVVANDNMTDDAAYLLAKSMYEQRDYLATVHAAAKNQMVDKEDGIIEGIATDIIHPGALQYYQEIGLVV